MFPGSSSLPRLSGWATRRQSSLETLAACAERWRAYQASRIDETVDPCDDMLVDTTQGRHHYRVVGLSALELLTDAMVLAGLPHPSRILEMPCGGGRVTRHLVPFFPDADIAVADVELRKVEAVTQQFGVRAISTSADFRAPLPERFDLIFVGSLLNHFDEPLYRRALDVLIEALAPGGVLVTSATGRTWASEIADPQIAAGKRPRRWWGPFTRWQKAARDSRSRILDILTGPYAQNGFAYLQNEQQTQLYGRSYGLNWVKPSWLLGLIEPRPDVRVLALKERGFDHLQDALILQRLAPEGQTGSVFAGRCGYPSLQAAA